MGFWRIERASDGFVAIVAADTREQAESQFDARYGFAGSDGQVDESDADEYAEFQHDAANDTPWYS